MCILLLPNCSEKRVKDYLANQSALIIDEKPDRDGRADRRASSNYKQNNPGEWDAVKADLLSNSCDILLVSPERLASEFNEFMASIPGNIGMLVVMKPIVYPIGDTIFVLIIAE